MKKGKLLSFPTKPIELSPGMTCSELLEGLEGCSFQGRNLARAAKIWTRALGEDVTVWLGLSGAMVPAGMRRVIVSLMERRYIDVLVSTGANLYHDLHETVGNFHYIGSHHADDRELRDRKIDRIYDTYADEDQFMALDGEIAAWAVGAIEERPYTTREFLHLLGKEAGRRSGGEKGILSTAAALDIPVYCPAIGDSSIGIALTEAPRPFIFDMIGDVEETAALAAAKKSLVIYVGGGTPKNFIQQTEVTNLVHGRDVEGHSYAIQFVVDAPHWGGLSGCTFEEAISWGKISVDAENVTVVCDATIALPIVAAAVMTRMQGKKRPGR
ncbi:MAG TPA: deoxyhypusine synthase [Candidatus Eisenbacteria bacterium]|uniref:Deoxyhypusine synthase n=1 Tax=Eiseniibacteriota bacterium TaxID=2212470 RepID=A0A7V2F3Y7_UNCEI|nr:deoxyhypusine synthase [Candidatus Eisenbacteria bacterium]